MKRTQRKKVAAMSFALGLVLSSAGIASGQWNSANAYGHSTGYGTVYGSYGLAATMQSMYNVARAQSRKTAAASSSPSGAKNPASSNSQAVAPPPARVVVRNHGLFRPDATVDTGKALADALGSTPEEKALIKRIYASTKASYETEADARGWKNNIAGGLTFFTVTAMTVYHDAGEPTDDAVNMHYKILNSALDEIPDLANVSHKDKQGLNDTMIGFAGILLAGYSEGKQNNDAGTLAGYKKLAGMLIEMVFKTSPENLRLDNGKIVMR